MEKEEGGTKKKGAAEEGGREEVGLGAKSAAQPQPGGLGGWAACALEAGALQLHSSCGRSVAGCSRRM